MKNNKKFAIEFRSGSYFQNLKADRGGPVETAKKFDSKEEAEKFMKKTYLDLC